MAARTKWGWTWVLAGALGCGDDLDAGAARFGGGEAGARSEAGLDARSEAPDGSGGGGGAGSGGRDARTTDATLADAASDAASSDAGPATCPCPGEGDALRCAAEVEAWAAAEGCAVAGLADHPGDLWRCAEGRWSPDTACGAEGCEPGEPSACRLPVCACFVRVAWCGEGAAREGLSLDPPCRVPLSPEHDGDILGCQDGAWVVQRACEDGCFQAPRGTPDACNEERAATPDEPGWAACASRGLLARGLHPEASDRLRCAGVTADRISQTIGNAAASAGYHAADGSVDGVAYCAAVDLRTRDLSNAQIRALLERLAANGFAAWYRQPGRDGWPAGEAPHIHAVFAGVRMKAQLQGQVRDFLRGLNGLASHSAYRFWQPTDASRAIVRLLFQRRYAP